MRVETMTPVEAWELLSSGAGAVLVDVRTQAEWAFVGIPDLSSVGREPILLEWQGFPSAGPHPNFVPDLQARLAALPPVGATAPGAAPLLFLCRSGGRSHAAAQAMSAAGAPRCINIVEGFEGPVDEQGHRGTRAGWKARGLPWRQS
jgi:rhodanese-related sulfurtransferase